MGLKILHTADWHLGKKLDDFSRLEEQQLVLDEICQIADANQVDIVLIAGDLFDTFNPSAEAQDLFYKTVHRLSKNGSRAVIAIAGNHDKPERIEAPHPLAEANGILFCGFPNTVIQPFTTDSGMAVTRSDEGFLELKMPHNPTPFRLIFTPYANEIRLKTALNTATNEQALGDLLQQKWQLLAAAYCDTEGVNFLMAHLYFMKKNGPMEAEPDGEKSILHIGGAPPVFTDQIPPQIQYTALGHLHQYQCVDDSVAPVLYSSSPLCYSFSEAGQTKKVVIIEAECNQKATYFSVDLKQGRPLLRRTFSAIADAVDWLLNHQNAYVELTILTENYIDGADRKHLADAHPYIIDVIPQIVGSNDNNHLMAINPFLIDETQNMEQLFLDYFKYKHNNAEPTDALLDLLKEVIHQNDTI